MLVVNRSKVVSYLVALLCTAAAVALTLIESKLNPVVTYSVFLGGIMVSAWYGGLGPGVLTTVLSALAIQIFLEPRPTEFYLDDAVRLTMFVLTAAIISELNGKRKRAQETLRQFNDKLESEVEQRTAELATANASLKLEVASRKDILTHLSASNAHYLALLAAIPDLMFRVSREGVLLEFVSSKDGTVMAIPDEYLGKNLVEVLPPTVAELTMHHAERALITGEVQRFECMVRLDDMVHTFEGRMISSGEDEVLAIVRDIGELKRKEVTLRQLTERLTSAQEDERRRLSRALHDEAGQTLTAITVGLRRAERHLNEGKFPVTQVSSELAELGKVAQSTQERLRSIAHGLHPSVLEHLGLSAALKSFISELKANSEISFSIEIPDNFPRLSRTEETSVYRIVQEAMTNAVRHSRAQQISLRCSTGDDYTEICVQRCGLPRPCTQGEPSVVLVIDDDGRGFDWASSETRGALGLTIMRERAQMIGARLDISSTPNKGTSVLLCMPARETSKSDPVSPATTVH